MPKRRKHHRRTARSNNLLQEDLVYVGDHESPTTVTRFCFNKEVCEEETQSADKLECDLSGEKVTWLQIKGLSDTATIEKICTHFEIPYLTIQDILNTQHIAKIEYVTNVIFVVSDLFSYSEKNELQDEHLCVVLGKNFVLTFQESSTAYFTAVENAIHNKQGRIVQKGADYLFNILISVVVDKYLEILEYQQNMLLDMEDTLMEFKSLPSEANASIHNYRRDYFALKKSLFPLKEQFKQLLLWDDSLIEPDNHMYFHDTHDHLQQASMIIEGNRETIASILELYLANNDLRMNHIMKQLTIVASIFIPLSFLVGVWGMNFEIMPELHLRYGYLFAWIIMIIIGVGCYIYFKKKKWY
ncbi:MAG: magnesium/cobalt transporter CorA [Bacteroidales bacterium]|jgi:magnesium transporter|nr:magnesium/cobalt transporter CorA [Bacteroidales bacterium]